MVAGELVLDGEVAGVVAEAVAGERDAGDLVAEVLLGPVGGEAALVVGEGEHELAGRAVGGLDVEEVEVVRRLAVAGGQGGLEGGELDLHLAAGGVVFDVFAGGDEFDETRGGTDDEQEGVEVGVRLGRGGDLEDVTLLLEDVVFADGGDDLIAGLAGVEAEGVGTERRGYTRRGGLCGVGCGCSSRSGLLGFG